jgi:hypothetical protein
MSGMLTSPERRILQTDLLTVESSENLHVTPEPCFNGAFRLVLLVSCLWGIVENLSCYGRPSACGPWNGYCSARAAFLKATGRQEPAHVNQTEERAQLAALRAEQQGLGGEAFADEIVRRLKESRRSDPGRDFGAAGRQEPADTNQTDHNAPWARWTVKPQLTGKDHADDIVRRMKEYKRLYPNRDFGRER